MAFKFIVKDEDLPKPTILSTVHHISIFGGCAIFSIKSLPFYMTIIFVISEFIQLIYLSVFYKKIVWGRYSSSRLRTVTVSFISTNIYFVLLSLVLFLTKNIIPLQVLIASMVVIFVFTFFTTFYLRKKDATKKIKILFLSHKGFSFPFYKYTAIIPMFILIPGIFLKSKIYLSVSILLLALGFIYTALGEYFDTKKKDELDRLIKYEASYIAFNLLPAIFIPLFLIETFWNIQIPWSYVLLAFILIHALIQTIINKRYE